MATGALTPTQGVGRQFDYWWTVYKRTWKGSIVSSFLSPLLYVLAMGVLLGTFIHVAPSRLEGATSYLAFVVPGLIAAQAMQTATGETTTSVAPRCANRLANASGTPLANRWAIRSPPGVP